jgi:hypothetical protein
MLFDICIHEYFIFYMLVAFLSLYFADFVMGFLVVISMFVYTV